MSWTQSPFVVFAWASPLDTALIGSAKVKLGSSLLVRHLYFANSASRAVAGLLLLNMVIARKPKAPHSLLWLTAIKCLERV